MSSILHTILNVLKLPIPGFVGSGSEIFESSDEGRKKFITLFSSRKSVLMDLSVAMLSVSGVIIIRFLLRHYLRLNEDPYSLLFLPVVLSSWHSGIRSGLFSIFFGVLAANYLFISPPNELKISNLQLYQMSIVVFEGLVISILIDQLYLFFRRIQCAATDLRESKLKYKQAAEQADKNFNLLNTVIEAIEDPIFIKDLQGKYIHINSAMTKVLGKSREEIVGGDVSKIFDSKHVELVNIQEKQVLESGRPATYEHTVTVSDGTEKTYLMSKSIYKDAQGKIVGLVGISHDITERKKYEIRLEDLSKRVSGILESITDAFFSLDKEGRFVYLNKQAQKLLSASSPKLIGKSVWEVFPEIIDSEFYGKYFRAVATHQSLSFEKHYPPQNKYFEIHAYPSQDGLSVYFNDITRRKEVEEVLKEKEERFRFLAQSLPQIIWTSDYKGKIDYFNKKWFEYTGFECENSKTGCACLAEALHPDDKEKVQKKMSRFIKKRKAYELEVRFKRKDGQYLWHLIRALPIENKSGVITKWIATSTDIDQKRKLEERKDEFIGTASHELKTPITTIKAFTQLLQKKFSSDKFPEVNLYLYKMDNQINRLKSLINDLLDVSKIQAGKLEFVDREFNLDELIREIAEDMQQIESSHKITVKGEARKNIFGDRYRIGQIITNLLSNAIKYSPKADEVILYVSSDNQKITIAVKDFGIGVPIEETNKIFGRFYRISGINGLRFDGMGLGLHIAKEIIRRHKGNIWVESTQGKGSTFYVTLPYNKNNYNFELYEKTNFSSG